MSDGLECRAAVAFERGERLRVETITVRNPGPGEVRVRVAACGICASDLHVWRTGEGIEFPAVLGHEVSGVIESIGSGVHEVVEGQQVVLAWIPRCGVCRFCRSGRTYLCTALRTNNNDGSLSLAGEPLGRYMSISGLSEYVVVKERCAIPIAEGLPLRSACGVGCGVTTGFGAAVLSGQARWGERVAIFGCGGVGLSALQGARIAGASKIIAVDPLPARLDLASRLGATDCVSPGDGDPVAAIHALSDGGVDLAIESVGRAAVVRQAFDSIAAGGRAIAVGLMGYAEEVSIPVMSLIFDKTLRGSIHGSADPARDFPKIFELAACGELQLEAMSGPDYRLEEINEAFEASANGSGIRPRILFDSSE
jgi:S-(hydroxymethyl)glutathione dehydrogenase/alcohol dehydrogenase